MCTPVDMAAKVEGEARALSDPDENRSGGTEADSWAIRRRLIFHDGQPTGKHSLADNFPCSGSCCPPNTQFPATPLGGWSFNDEDQKETMQNIGPVHLGTE